MRALAAAGIRDLIVILNVSDEGARFQTSRRRAAPVLLPFVSLPLVEISVFHCGKELLRRAPVVGVIRVGPAGQRNDHGVVVVVVPETIHAVAAPVDGSCKLSLLRLVFRDDDSPPTLCRLPDGIRNLSKNMLWGFIEDILRRVKAQAIETILVDPIRC